MTLPSVLLIGAMKCGTTSLAAELDRHPRLMVSRNKEPRVLTLAADRSEAARLYRREYPRSSSPDARLVDASTAYSKAPEFGDVPGSAFELLGPNVNVIYLVRDPLARIWSHLRHDMHVFGDAEQHQAELADRYLRYSCYHQQVEPWVRQFGAEKVLVLAMEDLRDRREWLLDQLADFLQVDARLFGSEAMHVNSSESQLPRWTRPIVDRRTVRRLRGRVARSPVLDSLLRRGRRRLAEATRPVAPELQIDIPDEWIDAIAKDVDALSSCSSLHLADASLLGNWRRKLGQHRELR